MKRALLFAGIAVLSFHVARSFQATSQLNVKPLTPMTVIEQELADNSIESHLMVAIRSDGATATSALKTGKSNSGIEARTILLPIERKRIVIADAIQAMSTFYLKGGAEERARMVSASPGCEGGYADAHRVGEESILGFQTYKLESTQPLKDLTQREMVWLAPALDCRALRFVSQRIGHDGQVLATFERNALTVTLGEPDAKLFEVPQGYREIPPSQANRELRSLRTGKPFGAMDLDKKLLPGMARMDQKYYDSQRDKP